MIGTAEFYSDHQSYCFDTWSDGRVVLFGGFVAFSIRDYVGGGRCPHFGDFPIGVTPGFDTFDNLLDELVNKKDIGILRNVPRALVMELQ